MTLDRDARRLILLALGTRESDDAHATLSCVVSILRAEAEVLSAEENISDTTAQGIALARRIEALEGLIDDCIDAEWRETAQDLEVTKAHRARVVDGGLRLVPEDGAP